jgi:hypothetical protein
MDQRHLLRLPLTILIGASLLVPGTAAAEPEPENPVVLGRGQAVKLMRTALIHHRPVSWRRARGHELACPTAFRPRRGGANQEHEIRRRCHFSWVVGKHSYRGGGIVWLGGESHGIREWHFQVRVVEEYEGKVDVAHLGGSVRP